MKLITNICFIVSLFFLVRAMQLFFILKQKRSYPPILLVKQQVVRFAFIGGVCMACTILLYILQ
ncbi:hypothetical protein [Bacillus cereus group sp. BfR-BA-01380]|uniref:hypothetical protein n=1 Tax=Bacillus cereus group sp. BfR-BA-01380 TaxID=2920324 RepID=UPI001F58AA28|nr:hypothetical protein [Bacillus cereus group sp. BfR-BA-01380]